MKLQWMKSLNINKCNNLNNKILIKIWIKNKINRVIFNWKVWFNNKIAQLNYQEKNLVISINNNNTKNKHKILIILIREIYLILIKISKNNSKKNNNYFRIKI